MNADIVLDATQFSEVGPMRKFWVDPTDHISREICKDTEALDNFFSAAHKSLLKELAYRNWKKEDGPIRMVIVSNSGKHRSLALARMLVYIYEALAGIDHIGDLSAITVDQPIHIFGQACGWWDCPYGCMCPG